jgi:hypothetical protein
MRIILATTVVLALTFTARSEVKSGPAAGDKVADLKVFVVTGESKDKEADLAAERKDKPTVYVFVQAEHWSRPMARFLKKLDERIGELSEESQVVAVWLTEKPDDSKEYLPKAQMSLQFKSTTLSVFTGEKAGPKDWGINLDAYLTAVVVNKGKVVASFGYMSVNDTDVPVVRDELKKALGK